MSKYIKKLDNLIKQLEKIKNKNYLLRRTIQDLRIDSYNLERYFKLEKKMKKKGKGGAT